MELTIINRCWALFSSIQLTVGDQTVRIRTWGRTTLHVEPDTYNIRCESSWGGDLSETMLVIDRDTTLYVRRTPRDLIWALYVLIMLVLTLVHIPDRIWRICNLIMLGCIVVTMLW